MEPCKCQGCAEGKHDLICEAMLIDVFGSIADAPADIRALLRERGRLTEEEQ